MLKNYIISSIRYYLRNINYAILNILGLAIVMGFGLVGLNDASNGNWSGLVLMIAVIIGLVVACYLWIYPFLLNMAMGLMGINYVWTPGKVIVATFASSMITFSGKAAANLNNKER